ncbi:LamG domain-containing protein [Streptomyces bathyalis]|uniref:LamG domain-containing protein n=1 Tax=Streptomyces bathyalis TaxID=2710756 RepID=A0A7T1T437_9ACTN|nr:LamG domain-containing protein [Streptomyces bathyalis]QPP06047.1 LamG domain-containing protein [Streptomyces bathyalis]
MSETAAGELAHQSWDEALRQQEDGSASGAVRPYALAAVLRTASGWAREGQRSALNPELCSWIDTNGPVALEDAATPESHPGSLGARAFGGLPDRSQAVLWHETVERDDSALTAKLAGAGSGELPALTGRARRGLHNSYVQIHQNGMRDDCRRFHRMVLAYADERSSDVGAELAPHLESCARCSQAVTDLVSVQDDCGALLARALLPWGGPEYAARRIREDAGQELFLPGAGVPPAPGAAATGSTATGDRRPEGPTAEPVVSEPPVSEALATKLWATRSPASGRPRPGVPDAAGASARMTRRRRTDLFVRCTAAAALCGVAAVVVLGFAGDDPPKGKPQSKESGPPVQPSSSPSTAPSPSSTSASATASPSKKPDPSSKPSRERPPSPPADGSAVEWLFDQVGGGITPDTSGNNKDGTLFGATPASRVTGGALRFDGGQFVASKGPLVDTSSSFSVSARVKLNDTDRSQTVVSQDGPESSGFLLQYDAEESQWEMRIPEGPSDDVDADADEAVSDVEVEAGEWTHLTGVYDEAAGKVRLYVDGRPGESVDHEEDFASPGNFVVGRGLGDNEFFRGVDGTIDDVRAFGKAVSPAEAGSLAERS